MKKHPVIPFLYGFIFILLAAFIPLSASAEVNSDASIPVYRLYNNNTGEHFYTISSQERDNTIAAGWTSEGYGWMAPKQSDTPVYRIYNPNSGDHHYTTSIAEKSHLVKVGWIDESICWYSDDAMGTPILRQYNPNCTGAGSHNYTRDRNEATALIKCGWKDENIGWYGTSEEPSQNPEFDLSKIPAYSGYASYVVNGNVPFFTEQEKTTVAFESYGDLDSLGRCTTAYACIDRSLMPTESRGAIGSVKPTGWHLIKYDCIDDLYLYNRCHLIGFQLTGENANEKNLITGTRYLNVTGMLPYENNVAAYIKSSKNHVLYRVTPIFEGTNLLASGVLMEAYSVEDNGRLQFCVYCYNVQPGVIIDYATGDSHADPDYEKTSGDSETSTVPATGADTVVIPEDTSYVLNTNTHKFHLPTCQSVTQMSARNRAYSTKTRDELINDGVSPCGNCHP